MEYEPEWNYQYLHRMMIDKVDPKQGDVTYTETDRKDKKDKSVLNRLGVSTTALFITYNIPTKPGSSCI